MLVGPEGEGGERPAGVRAADPLHLLRGRLQAIAQDDGPQQEDQQVEAGHPARHLQRGQEPRGIGIEGLQPLVRDEDPAPHRFPQTLPLRHVVHALRSRAGWPAEV